MSGGSVRRRRASRGAALALAVLGFVAAPGASVRAEQPKPPPRPEQNLFGMTGLIDMPTAEVQPDAQVSFTSSYFSGFLRNTASFQFLPWLETAFRYSVLNNTVSAGSTLYDRSFDLKLQLMREGPDWPAVALGLQDFLGTGIYSGEYVVATKSFMGGDLKLTGGLGWGRLAGANSIHNPFCTLAARLCTRSTNTGQGGTVNLGRYFSGENMSVFGGASWQTPIDGLTLKAEYSSDNYKREEQAGGLKRKLPLNFGLEYRLTQGLDIGAYYMYGSTFGVRLSLSGNPFRPAWQYDTEPPPMPVQPRPQPGPKQTAGLFGKVEKLFSGKPATSSFTDAGITKVTVTTIKGVRWASAELPASADYVCPDDAARSIDAEYGMIDAVSFRHPDGTVVCTVALRPAGERAIHATVRAATKYPTDWYKDEARRRKIVQKLAKALDPKRIGLFGIEIRPHRATVYIENRRYHQMPRAIGRTARAMSSIMPPSVSQFEIVPVQGSLPTSAVVIPRAALEDEVGRPDATWKSWVSARVSDAPPPDWSKVAGTMQQFPRFSWSVNPVTPLNLFDPDQPVRADLSVDLVGNLELTPGLSVTGVIRKRIVGQLDQIKRAPGSQLPHVRSDLAKYLKQGDPGIYQLNVDYVRKLGEGLYGRISAGYFEWMYGGVGAELLWKPADQSWGIGGNINYVRKRDFNDLFGFQNYDVVTGHASLYWNTGYYGLMTQIDAGRYLAGDWGGTFTLKRRFSNGWEIGGFFTLTNVPFSKFGEGSFDKGIFLTIPFNWAGPIATRGEYSTVIKPLTRDGGQQLILPHPLYPYVENMDRGGMHTEWGGFWK